MQNKKTICVLTPYTEGSYFGVLLESIVKVLHKNDCRVIVLNIFRLLQANFDDLLPISLNYIDGFIVCPTWMKNHFLYQLKSTLKPIITIGFLSSIEGISSVMTNNYESAFNAVQHLISHGHRKIGFAGWLELYDMNQRFLGYQEALRQQNIPFDPNLVFDPGGCWSENGKMVGLRLIEHNFPCTAIICANDIIALSMMDEIRNGGFCVEEKLAIIGFDDIDEALLATPSLTTVRQNLYNLANAAVMEIFQMLSTGTARKEIIVQNELILRASCGCTELEISEIHKLQKYKMDSNHVIKYLENWNDTNILFYQKLLNAGIDDLYDYILSIPIQPIKTSIAFVEKKEDSSKLYVRTFSNPKDLQSYSISTINIENFPPNELLQVQDHSLTVTWIYPLLGEKSFWGLLSYTSAITENSISNKVTYNMSNQIFEMISSCLDRILLNKENYSVDQFKYRQLLDNMEQGFMSVDRDLLVNEDYNEACTKIFGRKIGRLYLPALLCPDDFNKQDFMREVLHDLFENFIEKKRQQMILDLLPTEFFIENKEVKVQFKMITDKFDIDRNILLIGILDITSTRMLERKIKKEESTLKMSLQAVLNNQDVIETLGQYKRFCAELQDQLQQNSLAENTFQISMRKIHTFKGNFAQIAFNKTAEKLHNLETQILENKKSAGWNNEVMNIFFQMEIDKFPEEDLATLRTTLGEHFSILDSNQSSIVVNVEKLKEIEQSVPPGYDDAIVHKLLSDIKKYPTVPLSKTC